MRKAIVLSAVTIVFLGSVMPGLADDERPKKPLGTWSKTAGEKKVTFTFKPDTLTVSIVDGNSTISVETEYSVTKSGRIYGIVTKAEGGPTEGDMFSFKFTAVDKKMTIEDLKATHESPDAQQLIQGEYEKQNKDN